MPEEHDREDQLEDLDMFLSSMEITDRMVTETEKPLTGVKPKPPLTAAAVFPLLAWLVFLIAVFAIVHAAPRDLALWSTLMNKSVTSRWDTQWFFSAMCFLFANCVVCIGGLVIRFSKKMRLKSVGTLNLIIIGVLSAVIATILYFIP